MNICKLLKQSGFGSPARSRPRAVPRSWLASLRRHLAGGNLRVLRALRGEEFRSRRMPARCVFIGAFRGEEFRSRRMSARSLLFAAFCGLVLFSAGSPLRAQAQSIPLPEHPRPDFQRPDWVNLNGSWAFRIDTANAGEAAGWAKELPATTRITVPFSWASPLSGVGDTSTIGWYSREITVPGDWKGKRVFLVIGASDWLTSAWLDGTPLGSHQGGYTPFEFELTAYATPGTTHRLVIRVDDAPRAFKLEGKQGYGNARGIWQTPYLEARGAAPLRSLHFTPDLDRSLVRVEATLLEPAPRGLTLELRFRNQDAAVPAPVSRRVAKGSRVVAFDVPLPSARPWTLADPYLYEVTASVSGDGVAEDRVDSYFGMRKISVVTLPGTQHRYVALNGEPLYLELALDQAYHPRGFYTFPSDSALRDEILRAKQIGLNGLREHVKVESPRKLYWADRLGLLIMADVPNSWGPPDSAMRGEAETTLRAMIERDYNHPAIFSWVAFNEAWGLTTKQGEREVYLPETQRWVASVYRMAKSLDATRLVEDNSPCCGRGHTETDLNSWHSYRPGWAWENDLRIISDSTRPGSPWNFEPGYRQGTQPNINSEFGNVWGYQGSTGDVDWSWDYHRAVNAFRRHPAVAGWLYTEHHDVVNEWNGYWRFDRSDKETGLGELVDGMTLRDLHAPLFVAVGDSLDRSARPGERLQVPLFASFLTGSTAYGDSLRLVSELYGWDSLGRRKTFSTAGRLVPYRPWMTGALEPLTVSMPDEPAVAVLAVRLEDRAGAVLGRNFATFVVEGEPPAKRTLEGGRMATLVRIPPASFSAAKWSLKQWNVLDGLKVNGAGSGFFEYRIPWPRGIRPADVESVSFVAELSSKRLLGKDRPDAGRIEGDFMLGRGTLDPTLNPNSYPMTDRSRFPSAVLVRVNGVAAGERLLSNDAADHRGILSWHAQLHDGKLREAGSYGELVEMPIPRPAVERAAAAGELVLRLEVGDGLPGGLAIYGRGFGRYPLDPTLVFVPRAPALPAGAN